MSQLFENEGKITFVPDYTAVIHDDCTYLEIRADTYLLAYKSTLISRNSAQKDANGDANARPDGHVSVAMNGTTHKADDPDDKPLEDVQL
ncbi:ancient conserved domain protein 4 [Aphelenchoides avenae]|nr:ancient conserved domain protein 4 [Aphelenchus avenae]